MLLFVRYFWSSGVKQDRIFDFVWWPARGQCRPSNTNRDIILEIKSVYDENSKEGASNYDPEDQEHLHEKSKRRGVRSMFSFGGRQVEGLRKSCGSSPRPMERTQCAPCPWSPGHAELRCDKGIGKTRPALIVAFLRCSGRKVDFLL